MGTVLSRRALLDKARLSHCIPFILAPLSRSPRPHSRQALQQSAPESRRSVVTVKMQPLTLVLLGDIMLGRYVDDGFTCDAQCKTAAFGNVLPFIRSLDPASTIVAGNLECAVTSHQVATPKAFNFKLSPGNADVLQQLRLSFVATANNHVLDYGQEGLKETNEVLTRLGIAHAGSGTQPTASQPAVVTTSCGHRVAFLAYSDHYEDWAATEKSPGINFIEPASFDPQLLQQQVAAARAAGPDLVVVLIHWGPNWRWQPDKHLQKLGAAFLEAGADLVFGTSPHHIQGVELLGHKPIIYSAGSFIDDYSRDAHYRNDLSAVMVARYAPSSSGTTAAAAAGGTDKRPAAAQAVAPETAAAAAAAPAGDCGSAQLVSDTQWVQRDAGPSTAAAAAAAAGATASGGSSAAAGLILQELAALPIAITHHWRDEAAGPFAKAGGGNPPYFSQVDFAEGEDRDWVAHKLQQLSQPWGNGGVDVAADGDGRGVRLFGAGPASVSSCGHSTV